jgi:beta-lactamase class A
MLCLSALLVLKYQQISGRINKSKNYPYLASRLFVENPSDTIINFEPLRTDIKAYLDSIGVPYSFYFEYLFTGSNIRAGDNNQLVGASLMKIPIVMDLYKAAEQKKVSLDKVVTIPTDVINSDDKQYGNIKNYKPGDKITLRQAADTALSESDNTAAFTVYNSIKDLLATNDQALNNLDIETETKDSDKGKYALISARSYTSILKCLYFSCFLSYGNSQEIIKALVNSSDNGRIRAGVPGNIEVASKIGSFSAVAQSDCGIVYVSNRRYSICIMLNEDSALADLHIKKISEMTYKYVISQ